MTELAADLVEPAKSTALEKLGAGARALGIATAWLRPKMMAAEPKQHDEGAGLHAAPP